MAAATRYSVAPSLRPARRGVKRRLRLALALALLVLVVEIVGGAVTNSLALYADAGHVFGDVAAVSLALGAIWLAGRPGGARRTFGWYRAEIIAAMLNGTAMLALAGIIVWRALLRLGDEPEIAGAELLAFALVGLVANVASAVALREVQRDNLNVRGAYFHVLDDALGSTGVLIAGVVILATGWTAIDVIVSLGIAVLIVVNALRLLRETADVLLEAAPADIDVRMVAEEVRQVRGVTGVHDLHLWTVTSGFPALSCHLEIDDETKAQEVMVPVIHRLRERFGLLHVTLQPESRTLHQAMSCCEFPDRPQEPCHAGHRETIANRR